jgi:hypothetical protein
MAQQIRFFEKNYIDLNNESCTIDVIDNNSSNNGQDIVNFLRNRNNTTAWVTSGSQDSYSTQLVFNFGGAFLVDSIILVEHNFKSFVLEIFNGSNWIEIADETTNDKTTSFYQFDETLAQQGRITINGTMIADDNKRMFQTIFTKKFVHGQLESWAEVSGVLDQKKKVSTTLSGKANITQSIGGYTIKLAIKSVTSVKDIEMFQEMYDRYYEGFLMWLSGGDESQFTAPIKMWRNRDIFLVKPSDNYSSEWFENLYRSGTPVSINFREVIR